jgi:hypothetical protein
MLDTHRYYILANEDAHQKRPIKHEYGGTIVLTEGAESLARAYPDGWAYFRDEYIGYKE